MLKGCLGSANMQRAHFVFCKNIEIRVLPQMASPRTKHEELVTFLSVYNFIPLLSGQVGTQTGNGTHFAEGNEHVFNNEMYWQRLLFV
jgi:hypothetical protein